MRLFTALDLPPEVLAALAGAVEPLRPLGKLRWSAVENLHITTKFIGELPEERLDEARTALNWLAARGPIPVRVAGLGWFPKTGNPRVLWAGIWGGEALKELARETNEALARIGVPGETKPYAPHLTLARVGRATVNDALREEVDNGSGAEFGEFEAARFWLYESRLAPGGSVYTKLSAFPFRGAAEPL